MNPKAEFRETQETVLKRRAVAAAVSCPKTQRIKECEKFSWIKKDLHSSCLEKSSQPSMKGHSQPE